jgi:hypothetical protein
MSTVTFQNQASRSNAEPASQQAGGNLDVGSGPKLLLDDRLESARPVLESQPSGMIAIISKASLALHSA